MVGRDLVGQGAADLVGLLGRVRVAVVAHRPLAAVAAVDAGVVEAKVEGDHVAGLRLADVGGEPLDRELELLAILRRHATVEAPGEVAIRVELRARENAQRAGAGLERLEIRRELHGRDVEAGVVVPGRLVEEKNRLGGRGQRFRAEQPPGDRMEALDETQAGRRAGGAHHRQVVPGDAAGLRPLV